MSEVAKSNEAPKLIKVEILRNCFVSDEDKLLRNPVKPEGATFAPLDPKGIKPTDNKVFKGEIVWLTASMAKLLDKLGFAKRPFDE